METVYSKTPLGIAKICGDEKDISVISVSNEGFIPSIILKVCWQPIPVDCGAKKGSWNTKILRANKVYFRVDFLDFQQFRLS